MEQGAMNLPTALATLDPDNDDHWTGDGQPLVSIIQTAMRDETITRKQITEAAPQFTRASVRTAAENKEPEPHPADQAAAIANPPGGELDPGVPLGHDNDEPEAFVATVPMVIEEGMTNVEKAEVYNYQALAKGDEIVQARKDAETAKQLVLSLTREHDQLVFLREQAKPSPTDQEATRAYIESQNRIRAQRVATRNAALKGLKPEDLLRGSKLDEAHRRRNTRGSKRPGRRLAGTG